LKNLQNAVSFWLSPNKKVKLRAWRFPMKRATILFTVLVLLFSLFMVSCEAMFTTNIFGKLTHPKPSAADMQNKTPAEMHDYVASAQNMNQLIEDPSLKAAALANMSAVYGPSAETLDQQTAAVVAAQISIMTVPDAVGLSGSILSALTSGSSLGSGTPSEVASFIKDVLPDDIKGSVAPGAAMPSTFSAMIDAYLHANSAYQALGAGVGTDGGYAPGLNLSSSEKADIAVNAAIAGLIASVTPTPPGPVADALWSALTDPTNAASFIGSSMTFSALASTGPIANLVDQTSLGSMFK
jgi:hypothetical protein